MRYITDYVELFGKLYAIHAVVQIDYCKVDRYSPSRLEVSITYARLRVFSLLLLGKRYSIKYRFHFTLNDGLL